MQRLRKLIDEWALVIWLTVATLGMGYIAFRPYPPVNAAPAVKYQEPGCTPLGTVGNIIVGRCVDEVGNVVFANSSGFMAVVP